jgi:hypothetical protein
MSLTDLQVACCTRRREIACQGEEGRHFQLFASMKALFMIARNIVCIEAREAEAHKKTLVQQLATACKCLQH